MKLGSKFVCLSYFVVGVCSTGEVLALEWKPVGSDGLIAKPGHYFLADDLKTNRENGIKILCDDVVLDLRGHAISYASPPKKGTFGVVAINRKNIAISNGTIRGFWFNIHCSNVERLRIENVLFDDIPYIAINAALSKEVDIVRNRFTGFRYDIDKPKDKYVIGINIGADAVNIANNSFEAKVSQQKDLRGIETVFVLFSARVSQRCIVTRNQLTASRFLPKSYGVWVASDSEATMTHNEIHNMQYAICLARRGSALISYNKIGIKDETVGTSQTSYGVYAVEPKWLSVAYNKLQRFSIPILKPDRIVTHDNVIAK